MPSRDQLTADLTSSASCASRPVEDRSRGLHHRKFGGSRPEVGSRFAQTRVAPPADVEITVGGKIMENYNRANSLSWKTLILPQLCFFFFRTYTSFLLLQKRDELRPCWLIITYNPSLFPRCMHYQLSIYEAQSCEESRFSTLSFLDHQSSFLSQDLTGPIRGESLRESDRCEGCQDYSNESSHRKPCETDTHLQIELYGFFSQLSDSDTSRRDWDA